MKFFGGGLGLNSPKSIKIFFFTENQNYTLMFFTHIPPFKSILYTVCSCLLLLPGPWMINPRFLWRLENKTPLFKVPFLAQAFISFSELDVVGGKPKALCTLHRNILTLVGLLRKADVIFHYNRHSLNEHRRDAACDNQQTTALFQDSGNCAWRSAVPSPAMSCINPLPGNKQLFFHLCINIDLCFVFIKSMQSQMHP